MAHKRVLDASEVESLLATFTKAPTSVRNRALVVTMWRAGLRISEALALLPSDLDHKAGRIRVREGKGGKERTVAMGPMAWAELDRWLDVRRGRGIGNTKPVFCTLPGGEMAQPYVRGMLARKGRQAGIQGTGRVHPHAFRHAFAVELHRAGKPLDHIRRLLGHEDLKTTTAYLERIDPADVLASAQEVDGPADPPSEVEQLRAEVAELRALVAAA
jgi:site-specific recombinase XerD